VYESQVKRSRGRGRTTPSLSLPFLLSTMTVGSQLDLLLVAAASRTAHLNTLLLVSIPLLILFIFSRLRTPRSERAVVFPWTVPEEVECVDRTLHCPYAADSCSPSSSWSSTVLPNPSLNSHLSDHSLLPPSAKSESSRSYITAYAPASAQHLATVPSLTRDEIEARIGAAVLAQQGWRNSSWARRRRVMRSLLEWCVKEMEPLAKIASRDSGKTRSSFSPPFLPLLPLFLAAFLPPTAD
jgi:hypothetical protein